MHQDLHTGGSKSQALQTRVNQVRARGRHQRSISRSLGRLALGIFVFHLGRLDGLTFCWRCGWGTVVLLMRAEAGKLDHVWFAEDTTGAIMPGLFNFSRERSVRLVPGCAVLQLKPGAVAGFALSSGGRAEVNIQTSHPRIHLNLLHKFL